MPDSTTHSDDRPLTRPVNILLVDDQPANLLALEAILADMGANLVKALSGEEALRRLTEDEFAVILLDVQMHGLDGFETAKLIRSRERPRHTPIIFLTAYETERLVVEQAYALGAVDFLVKPLVPIILRAKVAGFLELFQKTEQIRQQGEQLRQAQRQEFEQRLAAENVRLREQREWLRVTLGSIGDAVIATDPAGRVVFLNPVATALTGWAQPEAEGQPLERVFPILHEQTREPVENPVAKVMQTGVVVGLGNHTILVARDGTERPIDDSAAPIRDDNGHIIGVVMTFRDVTEERRAERAVRESEAKFRLLADTIPQLAWMARPDGYIFWYNRRWYEYTGTTARQMEGWGWQSVHDSGELPKVLERWKTSIATGQPFDMVFPLKGKDGVFRPFLTRVNPLRDEAGRILYWFGTNTDISEQKRAEDALRESERSLQEQTERLRLLWEAAAVLLTTDDPDAMLRGLFAKIAPHFGLDTYFNYMVNDAGDALRLASHEGIPEETARSIRSLGFGQAVCGTVALERRPVVATFIQQSDDPKVQLVKSFGVRAYACNPLMAEGRLFGTLSFASRTRDQFDADEVGFLRIITHYVTVAYERLRLVKELRDANQHKDDFLAMLAHELRNPLAPIRNGLQILKSPDADHAMRDKARSMLERQVGHMTRIVDDLLDVSRITRGKIVLRKERLDLGRIVRAVLEDERPAFQRAGLTVDLELPEVPVWVTGDVTRLTQVLENLLQNAIKFTNPGGRVFVGVRADADHRQAILTVRDSGIGIEAGILPHLFETFAQADRSLDRSRGGLGLGLALVKGLVELHGGEVRASSAGPGTGAEFTVRLPLEPEPAALSAAPAAPQRPAERLRILVIEDNRDAADSLRMLLELYGYEVAVAYSGPEGVRTAERFQPQVVLCDLGLPGLNGYGVAGELRRRLAPAKPRLIAVTGYGAEDDLRHSQEVGFDAHLVKPVDPDVLVGVLAADGSPRSGGEASGHNEPVPKAASPTGDEPSRRVLVVDDNVDAAESLAMLLRLAGQDVQVAHDGPSALEAAPVYRPDLVFLDIGMPGMDGYEVCRRLRRQPGMEKVRMVALTGWGQEEDRRRSREAGFDHHTVKPVDPAVLEGLLASSGHR